MATKKIKIGNIPVGRGEWSSTTEYFKENTVSLYGMSFRALKDNTGVAPATLNSNGYAVLNDDGTWQLVSGTLDATNQSKSVQNLLAAEGNRQQVFESNEQSRQATFEANEAERQVLYEKVAKNTNEASDNNGDSDIFEESIPENYSSLSFYSHNVASTTLSEDITNDKITITRTGTKGNDQIKVSMSGLMIGKEYRLICNAASFVSTDSYIRIVDGNSQNVLVSCTITDGVINEIFTPQSINSQLWIRLRYNEDNVVTFSDISITEADAVAKTIIKPSLIKINGSSLDKKYAAYNNLYDGNNPTTYGGEEMRVFRKGICIGDSLTKGTFNYDSAKGSSTAIIDTTRSYPQFLAKMLGIEIDNVATGGATTADWWNEYGNNDFKGNDFAIIHLGINDVFRNGVWDENSAVALSNIITKLKADNKEIKIFVCTIFPFIDYLNAAAIASPAIADYVSSLNDNNVILLNMNKYSRMSSSKAYNNYHATALGYWLMATELKNYISWYINNNLEDFAEVQFIGTNYVL
jgi:hypothetical protein